MKHITTPALLSLVTCSWKPAAMLSCGKGHLAKSYDFWPMAREEPGLLAQPRQWAPIKLSNDTASPATPPPTSPTSWLQSYDRPRASITPSRHSLSNCWPQKLWENETSVVCSHIVLGVIHYEAIDNESTNHPSSEWFKQVLQSSWEQLPRRGTSMAIVTPSLPYSVWKVNMGMVSQTRPVPQGVFDRQGVDSTCQRVNLEV